MTPSSAPEAGRALTRATSIGTALQLIMVLAGHLVPVVANLFAVGGMGFSLVAGLLYAMWRSRASMGTTIGGGAVAGGVCGFIGIFASWALGDVPLTLLGFGTASSAVTGMVGAAIGRVFAR